LQAALFDLDGERDQRPFPVCRQRRKPSFVTNDRGTAIDAQSLAKPRNQEQQTDPAGLQNIPKTIDPPKHLNRNVSA